MNKRCKCGETLVRCDYQVNPEAIAWKCLNCQTIVIQRKRRPYKLNATKDIRKIRDHVKTLIERNPVTDKNREEWKEFIRAYIKVYTELREVIEKITIQLEGDK